MDENLSENEILQIINKLRQQYDEHAERYGKNFFNRQAFENRYMQALKRKMDLQAFIQAEVALFDDLRKKLEQRQEEQRIKLDKPFSKKIDQYIDELEDQWQKYPRLYESTKISDEAQFLCGAIQEFYNKFWLSISPVINKEIVTELRGYNTITDSLQKFFMSTSNKLPLEVENYIFNLSRYNADRADMIFLKEVANLLKDIMDFMKRIKKIVNERAGSFSDKNKQELEDMLGIEKVDRIIENAEQIIKDFRFTNLL